MSLPSSYIVQVSVDGQAETMRNYATEEGANNGLKALQLEEMEPMLTEWRANGGFEVVFSDQRQGNLNFDQFQDNKEFITTANTVFSDMDLNVDVPDWDIVISIYQKLLDHENIADFGRAIDARELEVLWNNFAEEDGYALFTQLHLRNESDHADSDADSDDEEDESSDSESDVDMLE